MSRRQQLAKSFKAQINEETWTFIPTGDLPDSYGSTWHDDKVILVNALDTDKGFLDLVVHESLHAAFPWMREWMVNRLGTEIAAILWKLGYRKQ